jgi:hypothetical protein
MDKEFQTTFIPKKSLTEESLPAQSSLQKRGVQPIGIFSAIAMVLFFVGIAASGGAFAYEKYLDNRIVTLRQSLEKAEKAFEPSLIIELQKLDTRLRTAEILLSRHISVSPVFRLIEDATLQSVQYDSFEYVFEGGKADVSMTGIAQNYRTVAEQSLVLGDNRFIDNHIFSNFTLNNKARVVFNLGLSVSPDLVLFEKSLGKVPANTSEEVVLDAPSIADTGVIVPGIENQEIGIPSLDPLAIPVSNTAPVSTDAPVTPAVN